MVARRRRFVNGGNPARQDHRFPLTRRAGAGLTAHFSVQVDDVGVGQTQAVMANYISGVATTYTAPYAILGPTTIPEPLTVALLAVGGLLLLPRRRR